MATMLLTNVKRCLCFRSVQNKISAVCLSGSTIRRNHNSHKTTHFGYQTVAEDEKEAKVYEVFHNVADKYDLMNDVMSGGIHRVWKDYFIECMGPVPGTQLIDVAGGTGDIAFRYLQYVENLQKSDGDGDLYDLRNRKVETNESIHQDDWELPKSTHVTVCDINQAMLDVGKSKAITLGFKEGLSWVKGNAECLPVPDNTFDAYTIAFGIRNTTHIDKVLSEAHRVLKPGGRFMCLEFSEVNNSILRRFYDEYSFQVIPAMGQIVAGDWYSYQYLVESTRKFPKQVDFEKMIRHAGFKAVHYENLMFGVAAIHSGFKL